MPFKKGKKINKPAAPPKKPDDWIGGLANNLVDEKPQVHDDEWVNNLMNAFKVNAGQIQQENKIVWGNNFHAAVAAEVMMPHVDEDEFNGNLHAFEVVDGDPVHGIPMADFNLDEINDIEQDAHIQLGGLIDVDIDGEQNNHFIKNDHGHFHHIVEANDLDGFHPVFIDDFPNNIPNKKYVLPKDRIKVTRLAEEDCMYRIILSKDKRSIYKIRCPRSFKGTHQELFNNYINGEDGFTQVDYLPNSKLKLEKAKHKNKYKGFSPKIYQKVEPIDIDTYNKATEKFYTVVSDRYEPSIPKLNGISLVETFNTKIKTCIKNLIVIFRDPNNVLIKGFTTGKLDIKNQVEIIGSKYLINGKSMEDGNFDKECKLRKYYQQYSFIHTNIEDFPFIRVRVKSSEESGDMFGFKDFKSDLVGKSFGSNTFTVNYKYKSLKLKKITPVVDIFVDGKSYKFLLSEVEFLYIDPEKFSNITKANRKILGGSVCKIIDDRRIDLVKGDIVTVLEILPNKNVKKSIVVVRDEVKHDIHKMFLKQLKKIINKEDDGSKNKEQIKKPSPKDVDFI